MKFTIRKKLFGGFSAVLLILSIMIGISYSQISLVDETYSILLGDRAKKAVNITDLQAAAKQEIASMQTYLIVGDEAAFNEFTNARNEYELKFNALMDSFSLPEAIQMLEEIQQVENQYKQFADRLFELKKQNDYIEYRDLLSTQGREITKQFDDKIAVLSQFQNDLLDNGNASASKKTASIKMWVIILGIIAVLLGIGTALFISDLISKPVLSVTRAAKRMAAGDLTVDEIKVKNKDEIGELASSFNEMLNSLRTIIRQIGSTSEQVAASSEELTASAEQTTEATNQIAASIQEVAHGAETQGQGADESSRAMQEVTIGIQQVAETASSVSDAALATNKEANAGSESLQQVSQQMNAIHSSVNESAAAIRQLGERSQEIGDIIEVITGIANQTNLLALNAAIEAARAGEDGKGFAVVATEIRKLAEQSRESATQIVELITYIQEDTDRAVRVMEKGTQEVAAGVGVVHDVEAGFQKILQSIEHVTAQIQEVSAVSEEMSASLEQVNASVEEMARIAHASISNTQNVAAASEEQLATMEEISASASALSKMAESLQLLVSNFKVK
ncbi:methyl-accepting chemotaxis protein [Paenibacillus sp. YSY-4.3]